MNAVPRLSLLGGLIVLSSCSRYVDTSRAEQDIQADIERQGRRLSLNQVICPERIPKQADGYFRCAGELSDGQEFTINVVQLDDQGTLAWDIPSSKALINLASLETAIQAGLGKALGKRLPVDCLYTYRENRRGDTFECNIVGPGQVDSGRVEAVLVKVTGDGNLEWQEMGSLTPLPEPAADAATDSFVAPSTILTQNSEASPEPGSENTEDDDD